MKIEDLLGVFKSLCLKLGEENNICVTVFNLYLQTLQNLEIITDKSNQIIVDDFRQAVINNEVNINALLDLIAEVFMWSAFIFLNYRLKEEIIWILFDILKILMDFILWSFYKNCRKQLSKNLAKKLSDFINFWNTL